MISLQGSLLCDNASDKVVIYFSFGHLLQNQIQNK